MTCGLVPWFAEEASGSLPLDIFTCRFHLQTHVQELTQLTSSQGSPLCLSLYLLAYQILTIKETARFLTHSFLLLPFEFLCLLIPYPRFYLKKFHWSPQISVTTSISDLSLPNDLTCSTLPLVEICVKICLPASYRPSSPNLTVKPMFASQPISAFPYLFIFTTNVVTHMIYQSSLDFD